MRDSSEREVRQSISEIENSKIASAKFPGIPTLSTFVCLFNDKGKQFESHTKKWRQLYHIDIFMVSRKRSSFAVKKWKSYVRNKLFMALRIELSAHFSTSSKQQKVRLLLSSSKHHEIRALSYRLSNRLEKLKSCSHFTSSNNCEPIINASNAFHELLAQMMMTLKSSKLYLGIETHHHHNIYLI